MAPKFQQISPILDFLDRYLSDGGYRQVFSAIHNEKAEKRRKNRFPIGTDVIRVDTGSCLQKRVAYHFFSESAGTDKLHNSVPLHNRS